MSAHSPESLHAEQYGEQSESYDMPANTRAVPLATLERMATLARQVASPENSAPLAELCALVVGVAT